MWIRLENEADASVVAAQLQGMGLWTRALEDASGSTTGFAVEQFSAAVDWERLGQLDGVAEVQRPRSAHPRVDDQAGQTVAVGSVRFGTQEQPVLISGPCAIESAEQVDTIAAVAAQAGAKVLRGGAFKPRSSPYSFSGHGQAALTWMREAADRHGLAVVTEVMSEVEVETVSAVADMLQIGSRNMQNYALLRAVGRIHKPVLLKRGMAATVEEWLLAGEHLLEAGASGVVYCARGISGFDPHTRNLLDLGAVALLTSVYKLPVVVDPSHAVGRRDLIPSLAKASLAVGASGLMIEAHIDPSKALSDGAQALSPEILSSLGFVS